MMTCSESRGRVLFLKFLLELWNISANAPKNFLCLAYVFCDVTCMHCFHIHWKWVVDIDL